MLNFFHFLSEMNHCVNFFLYTISGRRFRREFLAMFCCQKKDKQESSKTFTTGINSKNDQSISMKEMDSKNTI